MATAAARGAEKGLRMARWKNTLFIISIKHIYKIISGNLCTSKTYLYLSRRIRDCVRLCVYEYVVMLARFIRIARKK